MKTAFQSSLRLTRKYWVAIALVCSAIVIIKPMGFYAFDVLQSFAVYALICFYILTTWFYFTKRWINGTAALGAFLLVLGFLLPYFNPTQTQLATTEDLTVAHFNVFKFNTDYSGMIASALQTDADLLSFQEVDEVWAHQLEAQLSCEYPYYEVLAAEECCYGLAVFSKYPIHDLETHWWAEVPSFTGDLEVDDACIHFVVAHTSSPVSPWGYKRRRRHIREMANYLQQVDGPVLAIGDLNAVPWNPDIVTLRERGGLVDSRKNLAPTFPSWMPVRVPIDYILHSQDLACVGFDTIKTTRSDHYGIVGSYQLSRL